MFAVMRFCCIEVFFFHIFYFYWAKENRSLYRALRYIEVGFIEVPLYSVVVIDLQVVESQTE